ncbi:twitching motility protein PilT [Mycobacterium antarcticum]|uniref:type II toxin-antitoxin system VapC family toxin n=1 Tax=unclassified Mycolicibacterium TaxID=2636767 RepID=UPI002387F174|nr:MULTISPECIES: type II toxin-antitoxin system VapC family toxin [unclassified Mycolicibacterium]BDX31713.1 twitching motility protein PilT [Mycolicibacterium sp. TUM20985]GLP75011.1 twitching motility protein PilT [Mycolicibacterium sp. TUM20983]GLP80799.1 twitching motility protein PilT [Mycolicibacterium sp. TUM20984]
MNILVDTHTLLWLLSEPTALDPEVLGQLADPASSVWVSAASAWEIAIKTRLGRLDGATLLGTWASQLEAMRVEDLPIDSDDAILAGRLPWDHRDPFDRVIVAQALRRNLTVATRDAKILAAALTPTLKS